MSEGFGATISTTINGLTYHVRLQDGPAILHGKQFYSQEEMNKLREENDFLRGLISDLKQESTAYDQGKSEGKLEGIEQTKTECIRVIKGYCNHPWCLKRVEAIAIPE